MKFYCHLCDFKTKRQFRLVDHFEKNHIITCELMGGLGNQLFQIFNVISYSLKNNVNYILPDKILNKPNKTIRHTYWNNFLKNLKIDNTNNMNFNVHKEEKFNYKNIPLLKKKSSIIQKHHKNSSLKFIVYYQSYKYFEEFKNDIFNIIKINELKKSIKIKCDYLFEEQPNIYISLHFRIGDYVLYPNNHPLLDLSYYKNCINHIIKKTNFDKFKILYFCEEKDNNLVMGKINELKDNFKNLTFIKVDDKYQDWEQMLIMSLCKHNIIANSSFSWWGAYLNTNNDNIICYPSNWFGSNLKHNIIDDLIPPNFTKM